MVLASFKKQNQEKRTNQGTSVDQYVIGSLEHKPKLATEIHGIFADCKNTVTETKGNYGGVRAKSTERRMWEEP